MAHIPSSPSNDSLLSSSSQSFHLQSSVSSRSTPARSPPPILRNTSGHSNGRSHRSTSLSSSRSLRDALREGNEDEDEDRAPSLSRRGKTVATAEDEEEGDVDEEDDPITVKDRQSLINVQHPFGLPLWKPALYRKSRSVTRHADAALHSIPSAQAERHLLPGNIFWGLAFGWWLATACVVVSALLYLVPQGGRRYASLVYGLGWYLAWPFGKYVEGELDDAESLGEDEDNVQEHQWSEGSEANTVRGVPLRQSSSGDNVPSFRVRGVPLSEQPTITPETVAAQHAQNKSHLSETAPLLLHSNQFIPGPQKAYGATQPMSASSSGSVGMAKEGMVEDCLGQACFWLAIICIIAPLMLIACMICWGLVVTIPMAKLNWALIKHLFEHPTSIRFCAAPSVVVMPPEQPTGEAVDGEDVPQASIKFKHTRLSPGQLAPSGSPTSTVLLCTYRAVGLQYYKYTVGGVNILFVNLIPVVFFVIFDGMVLLTMVEKLEQEGKHVPGFLAVIASKSLIFFLSLLSVIPLSYFIGMAVASISAQSSIGMGAVINATFGSIIEIILYGIALTRSKGRLVEGSIIGSLLAGVLLMPGMSMCSGALKRKDLKFNAKSASVTSMMLIMAIIGALTPTLFYQTYGNFQLVCTGCPTSPGRPGDAPWICDHCYYTHPDPADDPFYQSTVKSLMYFCAAVLILSYLIGLWFSLRTHASQIWQNPQQLMHPMELPIHNRLSLYQKLIAPGQSAAGTQTHRPTSLHRKPSSVPSRNQTPAPQEQSLPLDSTLRGGGDRSVSPSHNRRVSYARSPVQPAYAPVLETVDRTVKDSLHVPPETMTTDDFTRAVAVATVSALRHHAHTHSPARVRTSAVDEASTHEGHDAPSWSRTTSASVLLACTALYAVIAELLVEVVDVILEGSGINEKFLGVTLFALVPNTTEFMNAISFALNGNIALSMEIGSAYALQVCLLQIPAMVAFSAWYNPASMGEVAKTFSLIFPRWDVIALILSMFLMTYTYIEAKSNYHRGSILLLSYLVLLSGFYLAPDTAVDVDQGQGLTSTLQFPSLTFFQTLRWYFSSFWKF